ncbi:Uncharacterised protein [Enterobacter hormaechei]|nr:hypothetical protein L379_01890 [Enterobacter sp. MGH 33]CZZ81483.1 Uncharacterised protein [Enterobacter hormaechei]VAE01422.1 Uncharacterised protein [Enterobacter hormaechei]VAE17386.1 Uncharacterised protein [Enterobacter hormaechei]VAE25200.1 Uncharacterised protein [Enterobacter hormaechei]
MSIIHTIFYIVDDFITNSLHWRFQQNTRKN